MENQNLISSINTSNAEISKFKYHTRHAGINSISSPANASHRIS